MRPSRSYILIALALLAGCAGSGGSEPVPAPDAPAPTRSTVYTCDDGLRFSARARGDSIVLSLPDRSATLPRVKAASGARYQSGDLMYWSKDSTARLERGDTARVGCRGRAAGSPWEEAVMLGIEFRALGQEPGWMLDLDQGEWLRFIGDYGATTVFARSPAQATGSAGEGAVFRIEAGGRTLEATITERPCRDAMSGESFSHTVAVRLDGRDLDGCGRALTSGEMTERYWKLIELDGRPVVAAAGAREAHLRLREPGQASGFTGCNRFNGSYEHEGDRLRFGPMATTRMACLDPALTAQERDFLAMLAAVDRGVAAGDDLTLYSGDRPVGRFAAVWLR